MNSIFEPLVSIVFTSYNHAEYLIEALDGLVNQTYPNIEIIIIDDCSTDGSQDIIKDYAHFEFVKIIFQKINSGSYVLSSNFGASLAKGDYVLFAQCDDFSDKNQISSLVEAAGENQKCGVVFSSSYLIDGNGEFLGNDFNSREYKFRNKCNVSSVLLGKEVTEYLTYSCILPNLSAVLIKNTLLKEVGGLSTSYKMVSDWDLWFSLARLTDFYFVKKTLNNFRQHDTTIRSSVKMKTQIVEIRKLFNHQLSFWQDERQMKFKFNEGFGAIWFSYFLEDKKQWLKSFPSSYFQLLKISRVPFIYLLIGFFKQLKEYFRRIL